MKAKTAPETVQIRYLNTDLNLISDHELTPLANALTARGLVVINLGQYRDGLWFATFESLSDEARSQPDLAITELASAVRSLDEAGQELWRECRERRFDVGYACGEVPWPFRQDVSAESLRQIIEVGGILRTTIYPMNPPSRAANRAAVAGNAGRGGEMGRRYDDAPDRPA